LHHGKYYIDIIEKNKNRIILKTILEIWLGLSSILHQKEN
jgi:hypothetical protein